MHPILTIMAVAAATGLIAVALVWVVRKPMAELLRSNAWMTPGTAFYGRSFAVAVALGAMSVVAGFSLPGPEQYAAMGRIEWVWWLAQRLEPAFTMGAIFLLGYVLLLTILFSVLGRYRDQ
jgi:hypothetical protein